MEEMAGSGSTTNKRSRAIASLTDEQAQHKRDIDRRAQRAFRQRTKDCIASLEQENARIREAFKNREAELEQENDRIRGLLRSREAELEQEVQVLREQNETLARSLGNILDLASTTLGVTCDDSVTTAGNTVRPLLAQ